MRLTSLLLELEGVVADTTAARRAALADALSTLGLAPPDDVIAAAADGRAAERAVALVAGPLALDATDAELTSLRAERAFEERLAGGLSLVPGARDAVARLAERLRVVVVTRAPARAAERMLALAELEPCVTAVVAAEHALAPKPSPAAHARALDRLARVGAGVPTCVVAFEDASDGLVAARGAGVHAVGIGPGARDATEAGPWLASVAGVTYDALVQLLAIRGAGSP